MLTIYCILSPFHPPSLPLYFFSLRSDVFIAIVPHFPIEKCNQLGLNISHVIFDMIVKTYQRDDALEAGHVVEFIKSNFNLSLSSFYIYTLNYEEKTTRVKKLIKDLNQVFHYMKDLDHALISVNRPLKRGGENMVIYHFFLN